MQAVVHQIVKGWLDNKAQLPVEVTQFLSFFEELIVEDGIVFKRHRCVTPKSMKRPILTQLRSAPMGLQATLRRA